MIRAVSPLKDVDGFGPESLGLLAAGTPRFLPCTPHGIQQLLVRNGVTARRGARRHCRPQQHRRQTAGADPDAKGERSRCDRDGLPQPQPRPRRRITRRADIVVVAIGQAGLLESRHGQAGRGGRGRGHQSALPDGKLVGDVDFEAVAQVAAAITPVPGGVGPMTITMLLYNTLQAANGLAAQR